MSCISHLQYNRETLTNLHPRLPLPRFSLRIWYSKTWNPHKKLDNISIRGIAYKWFESYIMNRFHYVNNEDGVSSFLPLKLGVPQETILGSLLLVLYSNDIRLSIDNIKLFQYADYCTVVSRYSNKTDL